MSQLAPIRRELAISLAATAITTFLWGVGWLQSVERPVGDLLLRIPHPAGSPDASLAAVLIDDDAVAALGPLPWPRSRIADLVRRIHEHGARGVVVDVILSDETDEENDLALERALAVGNSALAAVLRPGGGWLLPLDRFGGVRTAAHAHAEIAVDGVVRTVSATKQAAGVSLPALSVAAARLAGRTEPVVPGALLRPDFRQPPKAIPHVSAVEVLQHRPLTVSLEGRVVLLGLSASGASDQFVIPVGNRRRPTPGVLVHAAVASSLLRGGLLRTPGTWSTLVLISLLAWVMQRARSRFGRLDFLQLVLVAVLVVGGSIMTLWVGLLLLPVATLLVAAGLSAVLGEVVESRRVQRETGSILQSLVHHQATPVSGAMPADVHGRLELARTLQDELARDRDLRRTLLEGLHEGVVLWDGAGRPLLANAALVRLWGAEPELDDLAAAVGRAPDGWASNPRAEIERHGRPIEVEVWRVGDGHLGVFRDLATRRELERQRREMQRLVSHELKTPLSSIAGFGSMLETYSLSDEELRRVAGMIRGEAERLGEMVRSFLDLERVGSGQWDGERSFVELGELVSQRCELLSSSAASRRQTITVDVRSPSAVSGVSTLLERLTDNLVSNALKYSPEGSAVEVCVYSSDGQVALEVRDRGPGIPDDALPHLFERFYRVPGSEAPGSGLGLAFVKEIADWHGAMVEVHSSTDQGSAFTVAFPAYDGGRQEDG
jgi:signal transduction histidine kinase/CHASE2 domain-containing sensor protein